MEKMRQWSILTAVAVLALLVGGWFLLVSPQRSHAASLRSQASDQQSQNAQLQTQINQLEQQKRGLPAQQHRLNAISEKVPSSPELPTLIRQLSAAASGAGVDLVSMAPGSPELVTLTDPTAPSASAPAATPGTTSTTPAAAAAPAAATLARIPLVIGVEGSYYNIESFFRALEKLPRAVFVPQFTLSPAQGGGAGAGAGGAVTTATGKTLPANALTATITGSVFESPDLVAQAPVSAATSAAPAAPAQ